MQALEATQASELFSPAYAAELARVGKAVEYFETVAGALDNGELGEALTKYYGMAPRPSPAVLCFKALFFATRIEPVLGFVERFSQSVGRPPRMLDVGCGYGLETMLLRAAGAEIAGVDFSPEKARIASAVAPRLAEIAGGPTGPLPAYRSADITEYSHPSPLDAVYSSATLHHIEPVARACEAIARLLPPGGVFFLSDENGASPVQQLLVQQRIGWTSRRVLQRPGPDGKSRPYGNENIRAAFQWRRLLQRAGLVPVGMKYCRLVPPVDLDVPTLLRGERLLRALPLVRSTWAIGFVAGFRKPS